MTDEGNILFLVCDPCEKSGEKDFGIKLGERSRIGFYQPLTPESHMRGWMMKHSKCGGPTKPDHFRLGYRWGLNHDQRKTKLIPVTVSETLKAN